MKHVYTFLALFGSLVIIIGISIWMYFATISPDENLEEEARKDAEVYLNQYYSESMDIKGIFFDQEESYPTFDYAAEVKNTTNGVQFIVYQNRNTGEMEDTYAQNFFEHQLSVELSPYLENIFEGKPDLNVSYYLGEDWRIYKQTTELPPVQRVETTPSITVYVSGNQSALEASAKELMKVLQEKVGLPHASFTIKAGEESITKEY